MNSNLKGNIGEAAALKYFIENEYEVYLPFGTATKCDFIVCKDDNVERVSVKTTSSQHKNGKYKIKISQGKLNKTIPFSKKESDILFVYILPEDRYYVLRSEDIETKFEITLK